LQRALIVALLLGHASVTLGESECSDGECGIDENSLLALRSEDSSSRRRLYQCIGRDGYHECGYGPDSCCGSGCKAPEDVCCTNANGDQFACHGSCCGNACASPESKCCKVGNFDEWYPVSWETECRSPTWVTDGVHPGGVDPASGTGVVHPGAHSYGPTGGMTKGMYHHTFDWDALDRLSTADCSRVCRGYRNQCYPLTDSGYMGTPCGVLSQGDPQGCFFNSPTQTCALCDINGQGYCCPTSKIKDCPTHL